MEASLQQLNDEHREILVCIGDLTTPDIKSL